MIAPTKTELYEYRPYGAEDEPQVLELLRASLGESGVLQRSPAMWRWKHVENAFGPSLARVAIDGEGRVVGLRAFLRWRFVHRGNVLNAVRPVDTATHPDHQRRGIFERLTKEALEDARATGVALIYNTPNAQSMRGYLKMGWQTVGRVQPLVRVLNYRRFAAGLAWDRFVRKGRGATPYPPEAFFKQGRVLPGVRPLLEEGDLEQALAGDAVLWGPRLHTERSPEYLRWRYLHHPTIAYRAVGLRKEGVLKAFAIVRSNTRFGLREVVISELVVRHPDEKLVYELLRELEAGLDADYLIAYFPEGSFQRQALRRRGFRPAPGQGMTLVANGLDKPLEELASLPQWGVALGDLEFF